jgi:hypothetical protein
MTAFARPNNFNKFITEFEHAITRISLITPIEKNRSCLHFVEQEMTSINWKKYYNDEIQRAQLQKIIIDEDYKALNATNKFGEKIMGKKWLGWEILSRIPSAIPILEANISNICWDNICSNPNAIHLIEQNLDKVNWDILSVNPNAIHLIEQNLDKVNWDILSANPNAIGILGNNLDKVNWKILSENPNAMSILEQNIDKIYWPGVCGNPYAIDLIERNIDKAYWLTLSGNPNAIHLLRKNIDKIDKGGLRFNKNPEADKIRQIMLARKML